MALLTLDDVTKRYGTTTAVAGLSLQLAAGEVLCLLGPNGAGKTTTLKMVLGLEAPSEGAVHVAGLDVARDAKAARRRMAYIPERVALHEAFSGRENLRYFASLVGGADLSSAHLEGCLRRVGLQEEAWDRRLNGYSKGMRQKVGVAIALAKGADLLVLDEPTSGLDPKSAVDFARLIQDVAAEGAGVIMATHDLFRAKDMGTRIVILKDGRSVRTLDPAESSYTDVEDAYLGVFETAS
ncbi:MAG: ABC transporter ATP-binding protein [Bacteroidota bacterium]